MTNVIKRLLGNTGVLLTVALAGLVLAGCKSAPQHFTDVPGMPGTPQPAEPAPVQAPAPSPEPAPAPAAPAPASAETAAVTAATNASGPLETMPGPGTSMDLLRVGDTLMITFQDLPTQVPPIEDRVRENGTITLLHNKTFTAAGKNRGQLEKEIRETYVPAYYKSMTVTVRPQRETQFYYVGGEVRTPGRQVYIGRITVLKAIQSCGDFTDFANKRKVKLTRVDGKTQIVNCTKAQDDPNLDPEIYAGDRIYVPRSIF